MHTYTQHSIAHTRTHIAHSTAWHTHAHIYTSTAHSTQHTTPHTCTHIHTRAHSQQEACRDSDGTRRARESAREREIERVEWVIDSREVMGKKDKTHKHTHTRGNCRHPAPGHEKHAPKIMLCGRFLMWLPNPKRAASLVLDRYSIGSWSSKGLNVFLRSKTLELGFVMAARSRKMALTTELQGCPNLCSAAHTPRPAATRTATSTHRQAGSHITSVDVQNGASVYGARPERVLYSP